MRKTRRSISGNSSVLPEQMCYSQVVTAYDPCLSSRCSLLLRRLSRRFRVIRRRLVQPTTLQQRLDVGIASDEILEQTKRIGRTAATQQRLAKAIAIFPF